LDNGLALVKATAHLLLVVANLKHVLAIEDFDFTLSFSLEGLLRRASVGESGLQSHLRGLSVLGFQFNGKVEWLLLLLFRGHVKDKQNIVVEVEGSDLNFNRSLLLHVSGSYILQLVALVNDTNSFLLLL